MSVYERPFTPYRLLSFGREIRSSLLFSIINNLGRLILHVQNTVRKMQGKSIISRLGVMGMSQYRRMGKSSNGYVGLFPRATQVGDSIAIFRGGKVPFVIRKYGDDWQ